jgi:hypothetical protein
VIPKNQYKNLVKKWCGRIYQRYDKERLRFEHFSKVVGLFDGKDVLEIGANAGVQSLEICDHAKSYTGIEIKKEYFDQLQITMSHAKCPTTMYNMGLREFCAERASTTDYNSLYTSFVIYHFTDEDVEAFRDSVLPRADLWVIYNRLHRPTIKNKYGFEHPENTISFAKDCGFKIRHWEWSKKKIWSYFEARR